MVDAVKKPVTAEPVKPLAKKEVEAVTALH